MNVLVKIKGKIKLENEKKQVVNTLLQHLNLAIKEQSILDLNIAFHIIINNERQLKEQFGFTVINVKNIYLDIEGHLRNNYQRGDTLPLWSIDILDTLAQSIFNKKLTFDVIQEAKDKYIHNLKEKRKLEEEIMNAYKNNNQELALKLKEQYNILIQHVTDI